MSFSNEGSEWMQGVGACSARCGKPVWRGTVPGRSTAAYWHLRGTAPAATGSPERSLSAKQCRGSGVPLHRMQASSRSSVYCRRRRQVIVIFGHQRLQQLNSRRPLAVACALDQAESACAVPAASLLFVPVGRSPASHTPLPQTATRATAVVACSSQRRSAICPGIAASTCESCSTGVC